MAHGGDGVAGLLVHIAAKLVGPKEDNVSDDDNAIIPLRPTVASIALKSEKITIKNISKSILHMFKTPLIII